MAGEKDLGSIVYQVELEVGDLINSQRQVNASFDSMDKGADKASNALDGLERSSQKSSKAIVRSSEDASQAARMMEVLGNEVAILEERQQKGARAAVVLAAELRAGTKATDAQRKEIGVLAGELYDLKNAQDQVNSAQQKSTGIMSGVKTGLTAIASAIAVSQLIQYGKQFLEIADTMTQLQARIDRLSSSAKEGAATFQALASIASSSGASLKDTEKLWETLTSSLKSAGATNDQILTLTSTLQKIGRIGGSSSEEMANALRQFGQSIAGGTVRAEEFNSIIEQMPELARQMALGLGISTDELRKRMLEGKLSAEDALNAIMTQTGLVNNEFSKLPRSVSQATNSLTISFQEMVDQINKITGTSTGMVHVIDSITAAIERLSGKVPTATQQIADLNSTAEMFARRAKTYSYLGLDGWAAQAKGINLVSNTAATLVDDLAAISKANSTASNRPIRVSGTGDSKEVEKLEKSTKRKLELSKLEGEARARLQAQYDAEDAGIKDSGRIKALQDEYAATEKNTSARKSSNAEGKKSASQAESVTQKLEALRVKSEQVGDTTKELSRAQAILTAEQSLGKGATEAQIVQAGKYAAKIWDQNNALKQQAQIKQGMKFAQQEIAASQVMPDAVSGAVENPAAQIDLQEQQKLEALAKYQALDVQNTQLYEDAKTAIQRQAANARQQIAENEANMQSQAISSIIGSVSQGFDGLANLAAGAAGKSSGAYQAMFALSKGFAVAQAALNMQLAISQAMADPTALTPAQKFANYAAIASAGASLLTSIGGISMGGARKNGGPVSAGSMYQVGEGGMPEIYQASSGKQFMIPGDNGSVISNKDMQGGAGGSTTLNQVMNLTVNTNNGLDDATIKQLRRAWKTDTLLIIKDQQRSKGLLNRGK
ncbi:hypothetical protein A9993_07550 [Rahnella victoriana]|uniref:tape measure protein n=1 Tax=Rahnella victoriana TaxID=1510570 RepID=UPI000BB1A5C4|nr:tape measure protein [Rahnella victoriana]PBI79601.1 hypothetical protein A9993_07550 [Rahnella victoriana]